VFEHKKNGRAVPSGTRISRCLPSKTKGVASTCGLMPVPGLEVSTHMIPVASAQVLVTDKVVREHHVSCFWSAHRHVLREVMSNLMVLDIILSLGVCYS
jgi:hypothetical protein